MSRSVRERIADVERLLAAARDVVRRRAEWAVEIADATGLSREGVELGFREHVEVGAAVSDLERLVAYAGDAESVHVVLSANVFVAPLRAIAIARAASSRVVVRPSRRDPTFTRALVEAADDPCLSLAPDLDVASIEGGELHVYGRDETIDTLRARAKPRVRVRAHGTGTGVAIVTPSDDLDATARALAADVVAFDQRGCLSPRIVFVLGPAARSSSFATALDDALTRLQRVVPRGRLADDERASAARYESTLAFAGRILRGDGHVIGVAAAEAPLVLPPVGRHVHIVPVDSPPALRLKLAPLASVVVAVGVSELARYAPYVPSHARLSAVGAMQRPPLDGPVDRRGDAASPATAS